MKLQPSLVGVVASAVVVAVGMTEALSNSAPAPVEVVAAVPDFTYQLRPGDTLRVGPHGDSSWKSQNGTLAPVSQDSTSATFRAAALGVGLVQTSFKCGVNQFECPLSYAVVVTPNRPYDLALSGLSSGTYVLSVGEQVIFGYDGVSVSSTSPSVLQPGGPFSSPGGGLSVFRAARPGGASLVFAGGFNCVDAHVCPSAGHMEIKFIVSGSKTRFDYYASEHEGGTTINLRKGETFEVSLAPEPGYEPWRWSASDTMRTGTIPDQQLVDIGSLGQGGLIDPQTRYFRNQNGWILPDRGGFLVKGIGAAQMGFIASPANCRPAEVCPKLEREFTLTIEVDS